MAVSDMFKLIDELLETASVAVADSLTSLVPLKIELMLSVAVADSDTRALGLYIAEVESEPVADSLIDPLAIR